MSGVAVPSRIQVGEVAANERLCRDHYRLTFRLASFPVARPGQFVHLCPVSGSAELQTRDAGIESRNAEFESTNTQVVSGGAWTGIVDYRAPMLRRAYSIAGLRRGAAESQRANSGLRRGEGELGNSVEIDVIYRVVGSATRWMQTLRWGNFVSVLGPQGNEFPIVRGKRYAWMIAGGVGLPPMMWLAEALRAAGKKAVAFCGAQTAGLLALRIDEKTLPDSEARVATLSAMEFSRHDTPVVISTDDGSLGFRGHVGKALESFAAGKGLVADGQQQDSRREVDAASVVAYTCGPERMMRFVAEFCGKRGIECYVCMERNMACGTGLCQSCVVPVSDTSDAEGWRYRLCCTEGPIFRGEELLWE